MGLWGKFLFHFEYPSVSKLTISTKASSEQAQSYSTSVSYARRERMYYSHAGPRNLRNKLGKNIYALPTFSIEVSLRPSESLSFGPLVGSTEPQ